MFSMGLGSLAKKAVSGIAGAAAGAVGAAAGAAGALAGKFGSVLGGGGGADNLNPSFAMSLDGKPYKFSSGSSILTDAYVDYTVFDSKAGVCIIKVVNKSVKNNKNGVAVSQDFNISVGSKIQFSMGYNGNNAPIFTGYVYKVNTDVQSADNGSADSTLTSKLTVVCIDPKWYLMVGEKSNDYAQSKTYSAVVKEVLGNQTYSQKFGGLNVNIKDEPDASNFPERVACQIKETDFDFLKRLAVETGCLFFADIVGALNFVSLDSPRLPKGGISELTQDAVLGAEFEINRGNIPTSSSIVGIDPKDLNKIISSEIKDSVPIGSGKDSDSLTKNFSGILGNITNAGIPRPKKLVDFLSKAELNLKELHSSQAKLKLKGTPGFILGQKIKLKPIATVPDNEYLITGINHTYSSSSAPNFVTTLTLNSTRSKPIKTDKKL